MERIKYCLILLIVFSCASCSRFSTNPRNEFIAIQQHIHDETGYTVCQDAVLTWLDEMLSNNLSLNDVVQIALINNQALLSLYDELGLAKANLVQASLWKNPIFDFTYKRERLTESARIIELTLLQNFLDILLKPLKIRMAYSELKTVQDSVTARIIDMITEAKIAFHTLQVHEQILSYQQESLEALEASYELAIQFYEAGNMNDLELTKKKDAYERKKIDLYESELIAYKNREHLNRLMGLSGCQINWQLSTTETPFIQEFETCESLEYIALCKSLDLKIARQQICTTALEYGIKKTEIVFPDFSLGIDSERDPSEPWFLGPAGSIAIPIFDLGFAARAAKHSELSRQWKAYQAMVIDIQSLAREISQQLVTSQRQYTHYTTTIVPVSESVTHETLLQVNAMQISPFEVLNAKLNEIQTKVECAKKLHEYWKARIQLESLLTGRKPLCMSCS